MPEPFRKDGFPIPPAVTASLRESRLWWAAPTLRFVAESVIDAGASHKRAGAFPPGSRLLVRLHSRFRPSVFHLLDNKENRLANPRETFGDIPRPDAAG